VAGQDAGVDDVGGDPAAGPVVGVGAVQRQVALVDAVQAPRGPGLGGVDADRLVGLDEGDARALLERLDRALREPRREAVEGPVEALQHPAAVPAGGLPGIGGRGGAGGEGGQAGEGQGGGGAGAETAQAGRAGGHGWTPE
jgi:hypothetical protein